MKLSQVAKAVAIVAANHSILIYGPPKSGKTRLVGTAAKIPEIKRIFWFDDENGVETLLSIGLTEEELDKITIIKIADTRDEPIAIETILKAFTSKVPVKICEAHGRVSCAACAKAALPSITFCLSELNHNDLVVVDSGSQLGDSAMAALCLGKDSMFKPGWDEFGIQGKWLGDILSVIQACKNTNFVVITHEIALDDSDGKQMYYPLMGTKNFSMKVAKYFGTVVYVHKKMNKHTAGSSSTYLGDRLTGSRVNAKIEDNKDKPDMRTILIDGGILKPGVIIEDKAAPAIEIPVDRKDESILETGQALATAAAVRKEEKKESFAERIARIKKEAENKDQS